MAKSKKTKPSFDAPPVAGAAAAPAWVYRSDDASATKAAPSTKAGARAAASAKAAPSVKAAASTTTAPRSAAASTAPATTATATTDRAKGANALIERYATYSAAAGLVPIPAVDAAAIAGVQLSMLRALAAHYDVPFSTERGKSLIAALLGGLMPSLAGYQLLKIAGPLAGMVGVSGFAMTSTWAVGQVFASHFESGGTLLDVNIEQSRRKVAAQLTRS